MLLVTLSSQAIIYIRREGMINPCEFAYVKYMHSNTRGRCCTFLKYPLAGRELSFYGLYSALFIFPKNPIPQHPNLHVTRVCWVVFKITTSFVGAHRLSHGAYESRGWSAHWYMLSTLFIDNSKALLLPPPLPPTHRPPILSESKQTHPPGDRSHRCGGEGVVDRIHCISLY